MTSLNEVMGLLRPCRSCGFRFQPQSSRQFDCHDCRKRDKRKPR